MLDDLRAVDLSPLSASHPGPYDVKISRVPMWAAETRIVHVFCERVQVWARGLDLLVLVRLEVGVVQNCTIVYIFSYLFCHVIRLEPKFFADPQVSLVPRRIWVHT